MTKRAERLARFLEDVRFWVVDAWGLTPDRAADLCADIATRWDDDVAAVAGYGVENFLRRMGYDRDNWADWED